MKKAILNLETLACPTCMQKIEAALKQVDGVDQDSVTVLFNASKAKATFDESKTSLDDLKNAVQEIGYSVLKSVEKSA